MNMELFHHIAQGANIYLIRRGQLREDGTGTGNFFHQLYAVCRYQIVKFEKPRFLRHQDHPGEKCIVHQQNQAEAELDNTFRIEVQLWVEFEYAAGEFLVLVDRLNARHLLTPLNNLIAFPQAQQKTERPMFHADHTLAQILAHGFMATLFIIVGVRNSLNWANVIKRMTELSVPVPRLAFPLALVVQFTGAVLIAIDYCADIGAALLIIFTVTVTAFYHRYWCYADASQRQVHFQFLFNNLAVIGGLMLLA